MININPRSNKPLYEQIVDGVKENILKELLSPGEKLPSVREMSKLLTVNPNTVSKAYLELERQKVIETLSGKGTFVSSSYSPKLDLDKLENIKNILKDIIIETHYLGIEKKDFFKIVNDIYSNIERV
ncbi:GntR family transcriptional regulator [Herbivorax sp. ANBcel31]|uniref:GntR family transcriptional regulator n=1 Tax=Herbivorax sp. ANBcel31 TaxID=3069754 RepID=UPI0027B4615C|nr:GntR family transcriptional regulator [Herbivorax sp. ANBcel31]MDQ2087773.1 GntR family transcriptional regulator [Herbivorax sp. ANBcel31]